MIRKNSNFTKMIKSVLRESVKKENSKAHLAILAFKSFYGNTINNSSS